jgi:pyruvate dehydrogenase E1 component beta subunit
MMGGEGEAKVETPAAAAEPAAEQKAAESEAPEPKHAETGARQLFEAADRLAGEGIEAEVIDLRTLRPLDKQAVLTSLAKTNRVVVVEEGWPTCSIASEISAICMEEGFDDLDAPVMRVTNVDVPLPYAANLEKLALIKADDVVEAVKAVTYR